MNSRPASIDDDLPEQPKVLLVDDDEVNLLLTSIALRERGFAINNGRTEIGVTAVGRAVHGTDGRAEAAVSISLPTARYSRKSLPKLVAALAVTTADIERTTEEQVPAAAIRDAIAASFSAGGAVTEEQAQCLAQSIVDSMGLRALNDVGAGADFSNASPEVQQQLVEAVSDAAAACDVPVSQLGG